jgi:hypothetical protein
MEPGGATRRLGWVLALALIASYLVTWRLWSVRTDPPNLPAIAFLRTFEYGVPLLITAALAMARPRIGAVAHAAVLALAMLGDQLRLQPEFVSLALLLVAVAWAPQGFVVGRWHLLTVWLWAGLHKVFSAGWPRGGAAFIAHLMRAPSLRVVVAVAVPLAEIALALLALDRRRGWRVLRIAAPIFHVAVMALLASRVSNVAVWAWNLALAAAAFALFAPVAEPQSRTRAPRPVAVVGVVMLLFPAGFYAGVVDAYLAHNLYSSNGEDAFVCRPRQRGCHRAPFSTSPLRVPMPPEGRLYRAWFDRTCIPTQVLVVRGTWTRFADRSVTQHDCPERD